MGLSDLTRFVQFACALALFGTAAWQQVELRVGAVPGSGAQGADWPPVTYVAGCLLGAIATIGWLFAQAKAIGGTWSAIGAVITSTHFGQVALLRAALLATAATIGWRVRPSRVLWRVLGVLTAGALVSFVWTGHGTEGVGARAGLHIVADILHLSCAALWIGALLMLSAGAMRALATKTRQPTEALLAALSRFSAFGPALIALLVATGIVNTWLLVGAGHWIELMRQPYGWALIVKLALFAAMLAMGARHRYRSSPALQRALASDRQDKKILGSLRKTLLTETLLAILVLAAVAVLGDLEPPASHS